jgi:radical SAM superfamily enzyme YgiQ (UPF0313 family)
MSLKRRRLPVLGALGRSDGPLAGPTEARAHEPNGLFLFVNPPTGARTIGVNHGIAALAPIPRRHGYRVECLNLIEEATDAAMIAEIERRRPSVVAFSATSHQFDSMRRYSLLLRRRFPELLQIAGGVHASLDPEGTLSKTGLHGVCMGEGEVPLEALLERLRAGRPIDDTPGFAWKVGDQISKNVVPPIVEDLSTFEFPDYSLFDSAFVVRVLDEDNLGRSLVIEQEDSVRYIEIMLSRGCPYNCHYCLNAALAKVASSGGKYFRVPTVEYAIRLIESVREQYPDVEHIEFLDDLLIANKKWFEEFARVYKERIGLPYRTNGRFECITPEVVRQLKDSGCQRLMFGLETGSEWMRKHVCNRRHSNELVIEKLALVKNAGIEIMTLNIIGFPFETRGQMLETLMLNMAIGPHFGTTFFFNPYKGTDLHRMCKDANLLYDDAYYEELTNNSVRPFIKLSHASEQDCIRFQWLCSVYFFSQTARYRIERLMRRSRLEGAKPSNLAFGVPLAVGQLLTKGLRIYWKDYVVDKLRFGSPGDAVERPA